MRSTAQHSPPSVSAAVVRPIWGAFTGASAEGQQGKVELAGNGTLFLDEIGEMEQEMQAKLLRLVQEREFYRVGGNKRLTTEARIVCATNKDIERRVADGAFREDLYHRLSVGRLHIPPLRERREEILPLAEFFLSRLQSQHRTSFLYISDNARDILQEYHLARQCARAAPHSRTLLAAL
jgi:transcriptional regulator with PAS, ATPase and Fis domain